MTRASAKPVLDWHWLVLVAILGLYLVLATVIAPGADTLWRLHIGQSLLEGQALYRDIIEVNPPLWFWAAMPAAAMGGYPALVGINLVATLIGLVVFGALLDLTQTRRAKWAGVLGLAVGLVLVSVAEIGQREQAYLLASALWCGLATARMEGKAVGVWLAVVATFFAAYGFALKHYFVLVPIAIEVGVIWHRRRLWKPFRIETLLLATLAITYGVAVIYLTPDYLGRVLGLVQASYSGFGIWSTLNPRQDQLRLILQCICFALVLLAAILTRPKTVLVRVLLVAWAISILVVVLQQRGWRYHLIGANGLSILILSLLWRGVDCFQGTWVSRFFVPICLGGLIWAAILAPAYASLKSNGQPVSAVLAQLIAREPRDHHIAILSTAPDYAFFPLARAKRAHWSRHFSMWMMQGLLTPQEDPKREALRLMERARVLKEFTSDLTCRPPDLIVGEVGAFRNAERTIFDSMMFLREDRVFSSWVSTHYRRVDNAGRHPIWRLAGLKPAPQNCTTQRLQ